MYGSLDISVSGMVAQRTRLTTIASNLANSNAILDAEGNPDPYKRKIPVFMPGDPSSASSAAREMGVRVARIEEDLSEPLKRYEPGNPYAKPEGHPDAGYVYYPNVNSSVEQVNAMEALRAYEANVVAAEASKTIMAQALRMLA